MVAELKFRKDRSRLFDDDPKHLRREASRSSPPRQFRLLWSTRWFLPTDSSFIELEQGSCPIFYRYPTGNFIWTEERYRWSRAVMFHQLWHIELLEKMSSIEQLPNCFLVKIPTLTFFTFFISSQKKSWKWCNKERWTTRNVSRVCPWKVFYCDHQKCQWRRSHVPTPLINQ